MDAAASVGPELTDGLGGGGEIRGLRCVGQGLGRGAALGQGGARVEGGERLREARAHARLTVPSKKAGLFCLFVALLLVFCVVLLFCFLGGDGGSEDMGSEDGVWGLEVVRSELGGHPKKAGTEARVCQETSNRTDASMLCALSLKQSSQPSASNLVESFPARFPSCRWVIVDRLTLQRGQRLENNETLLNRKLSL